MNPTKQDIEDIDSLLNDPCFRKVVEEDIGKVSKVSVVWEKNELLFHGERQHKTLPIVVTLEKIRADRKAAAMH